MRHATLFALAFLLAPHLMGHTACAPHVHPNFVVVMTDDQRADTLQYMPNVQAELVGKGVSFSNAYVADPTCCPSRASFFSGKWAHNTRVVFNRPSVVDEPECANLQVPAGEAQCVHPNGGILAWTSTEQRNNVSWSGALRFLGYKTALVGKGLNANDLFQPQVMAGWDHYKAFEADGFNYFGPLSGGGYNVVVLEDAMGQPGVLTGQLQNVAGVADEDYSTDLTCQWALDWLEARAASEQWALVWTPYGPHFGNGRPGDGVPSTFYDVMPAPRHLNTSTDTFTVAPSYDEADIGDKPEWLQNALPTVWSAIDQNVTEFRHQTVEALQSIDECIPQIIDAVYTKGTAIGDATMFVFLSDNGYLWGEHRLGMKGTAYEESWKVPMVVRYAPWNPLDEPRTEDRLVSSVDLGVTIAKLANPNAGFPSNGVNLAPILKNEAVPGRASVLGEGWTQESEVPNILIPGLFPLVPDWAAVRSADGYKLVDYRTGTDELYDLTLDPYELDNRIDDAAYDVIEGELRAELAALLAQ